jgi:hypothetical protein
VGTVYPLTIAQPRQRYDELAEVAWARSPPDHLAQRKGETTVARSRHEIALEREAMKRSCDMATWSELAAELGTSKSTLYRVTQEMGLKPGELDDAGKARVREAIVALPGRWGSDKRKTAEATIEDVRPRKGLAPKERRKRAIAAAAKRSELHAAESDGGTPEGQARWAASLAEPAPRKRRAAQTDPEPALCRAVLAALWPEGVAPEQYAEVVRVVLSVSTVPAEVR